MHERLQISRPLIVMQSKLCKCYSIWENLCESFSTVLSPAPLSILNYQENTLKIL